MNAYETVKSMSMLLPEDILKRKWAGDFTGAMGAIDCYLARKELPKMLRDRLICERERIRRLPTQYPYNRQQAFEKLQELMPDATEEEFERYELAGDIDFIYVNGEKRYFVRALRSLVKFPEFQHRLPGGGTKAESPFLDPMIETIRKEGVLSRRIEMEASVYCPEKDFVPGRYHGWVPVPTECAQQSDIEITAPEDAVINPPTVPARCVYFDRQLDKWEKFSVKYAYTSTIRYADPLNAPAPAAPLYPAEPAPTADDLAEDETFIRFSPYLRSLAAEITEGETLPVRKAWKIYEFITTKVKYSFMRDYFQFDNLGEYCAINMKGDCGLQALLFIELCRICGIPARWQSGMAVEDWGGGSHDWAQFYLDGWGWLFCDPSYGGGGYRAGSKMRHDFYFGNLDPMRMAANRQFMAPLTPDCDFLRVDPYDNQSGEITRVGMDLPFTGRQVDGDADLVKVETL